MKRRLISTLLLISLLVSIFAASGCGDSADKSDETTAAVSGSDVTTADPGPQLELPEVNYEGKEFTILSTVHAEYEYVAEEMTGDVVSDAVYNRNRNVEDLLGINFNIISEPGHWDDKDNFNHLITSSVMAGDGAYDLINGVTVCVLPIASDGMFVNSLDLDYINFDNPWWIQGMEDDLAIGGKLFGFIGDASLSMYKDISVIYFNKTLIDSYKLENPYDLVRNGTWTIDKLAEMSAAAASDLNGDGAMDTTNDQFGYITAAVPQRTFQTATEFKVIRFDESGNPYVADLGDHEVSIFEKMNAFVSNKNDNNFQYATDQTVVSNIFNDERALFMCQFLYCTEYLRDMKSDFGIIPVPKYDEAQEKYHSQIGTSTSMFFIPRTTNDLDLTSMVCEALCYYSWRDVVPAYYEIALKEKYTRDEDVKEMLELIRNSAQMDFTFAYSTIFSPFTNMVLPTVETDVSTDYMSKYESHKSAWQSVLDSLIDSYSKLS